jgi:hypothetical protein
LGIAWGNVLRHSQLTLQYYSNFVNRCE